MENESNKNVSSEESKQSAERGKDAIDAHEKLFNKEKPDEKKKEDREKDAEKWRNEG